MIRAEFHLTLGEDRWIGEISRAFPEATLRLLSAAPLGDRSLELGAVYASDPQAVVAAIRDHSDVRTYDLLYCDEERALSKYETTDRSLFEFLGSASLLPEFPLDVRDGEMAFAVTATRSEFEAFGDRLDASDLRYDLRSVVHRDDPTGVLTPRQRECLAVARGMGYFEVPRQAKLADVADALDVDTSSVSETLRRGTARVLEGFLTTPRGSGSR